MFQVEVNYIDITDKKEPKKKISFNIPFMPYQQLKMQIDNYSICITEAEWIGSSDGQGKFICKGFVYPVE